MSDLFNPRRNLVGERNAELDRKGRKDIRWQWRNPNDWDAGMELVSAIKPRSKL